MKKNLLMLTITLMSYSFQALAANYDVGLTKLDVTKADKLDTFPLVVLYPSSSASKNLTFGPFTMKVAMGGDIVHQKFPLVILSHGSGGSSLSYKDIAISLVKQGFIVVMPLHPNNNYLNNDLAGTVKNYQDRPKQLQLSLDKLLADSRFSDYVDSNKIAAIGHSIGGYSVLAAAGGTANTKHIINLCTENKDLADPYCRLVAEKSLTAAQISHTKDNRIKALVLMAPVGILFHSKGALDNVDMPVLLLNAQKDEELTEPYNSNIIAKQLADTNKLTTKVIENAGHYAFLTSYPLSIKSTLGAIAHDPDGFDRAQFQNQLGPMIADFLSEAW
jgi:predicted dienelactone hydrolase